MSQGDGGREQDCLTCECYMGASDCRAGNVNHRMDEGEDGKRALDRRKDEALASALMSSAKRTSSSWLSSRSRPPELLFFLTKHAPLSHTCAMESNKQRVTSPRPIIIILLFGWKK